MLFQKLGIKSLLLCIRQIKDFNSLVFLGGGRFSNSLTFSVSGLTPFDEIIVPQNAIFVFPKEHFLGLSVKLALSIALMTS